MTNLNKFARLLYNKKILQNMKIKYALKRGMK